MLSSVCTWPGSQARTFAFFDELSDLLDHLSVLDVKFILCGDFNCPEVITGPTLDDRLMDVVTRYNSIQHVNVPTHRDGNLLDLVLTLNSEANFISLQSVCSTCFSDHHLLCCEIGINRPLPTINMYSFWRINSMCINAFRSFDACVSHDGSSMHSAADY